MDRIVIDLDRSDLKMIVDPDIQTTAECTGKASVGNGFVSKPSWARRPGRRCTRKLGKFRTSGRGADQRVSERLPRSAVSIIFYLNAAEIVVQRILVLGTDVHGTSG